MKILLTGNGGFIGSHLMDSFLQEGHDIVGIDNFSTKNSSPGYVRNHSHIIGKRFKHYVVDLRNEDALQEVIDLEGDIDVVCHQAAFGGVPQSLLDPAGYYRNNVMPLIHLIACLPKAKYIFASSSSTYGMLSPYALTKKACEEYLEMSGVRYIVFRYFNVFGDRQLSGPVVAKMVKAKNNNEIVPLYGNAQRDFTYVKNVVSANNLALMLLQDSKHKNFICDIGCGAPTSVSDLAKLIGCKTIQESARDGDLPYSCAKTKDVIKLLGGVMPWSLKDGLRDMGVI